jgi:phosphoribosylpyrophosphate synthetase
MRKYNKLLKDNEKLKKTRTQHLKEINEMNLDGDWDQKKQVLVDELRD